MAGLEPHPVYSETFGSLVHLKSFCIAHDVDSPSLTPLQLTAHAVLTNRTYFKAWKDMGLASLYEQRDRPEIDTRARLQ